MQEYDFQCVARGQEGNSGESLIITDPKSELYESMSAYLENEGYVVKAFNLVNPENSDSWNCLGEINGQETMAQVFADVIIQNTGSGKGDHFWDNAEMNLLKAWFSMWIRDFRRKPEISDRFISC